MAGPVYRVAHPPAKALLVYDGDCGFCKLWITRWQETTAGRVEYATFQEVGARFPEIPRAEFSRAVKLIEPTGEVSSAAEAVFRSLGTDRRFAPGRWCYQHLPGFAAFTEAIYALIANHREAAHWVTSIFWGEDVRRPTYFRARHWFLRSLGAIYFIAFLSLWVQVDGLIGAKGILPVGEFLSSARAQLGGKGGLILPTLCWLNSSDAFVHFLCGAGAVLSVLLVAGMAPILCLALLFALYLSLSIAGQTFLSFQWDILLLEAGFLAIFLAPWRWFSRPNDRAPSSRLAIFLLQFLLFKLMFMSGAVKLTSGDESWTALTALDFHYWTQPLPTVLGWWADKSPDWFKHFSTAFVLGVELVAPFLFCLPRRLRLLGATAVVLLQLLIGLTGNYAFFNLTTIALCLLLIDDYAWPSRRRTNGLTSFAGARSWPTAIPALVLVVTLPVNAMLLFASVKPEARWPASLATIDRALEPFRIVNGYGLFRVMTKERPEIVISGSNNGIDWQPYEFKWKAGALERPPRFVEPHQPRLDWQMWFAALGSVRENPWFVRLAERLLENEPAVTKLLAKNPFPGVPPRYLRADIYRYRFATMAERRARGVWWERADRQTYLPQVSLRDGE